MATAIRESVKKTVWVLCEMHNKEVSDLLVEVWNVALDTLSDEELSNGMQRHVKENKNPFMPMPAEFMSYCKNLTDSDLLERSSRAWSQVEDAVKAGGHAKTIHFADPRIHHALSGAGGWRNLCGCETSKVHFIKKEFIEEYKCLAKNNVSKDENLPLTSRYRSKEILFIGDYEDGEKEKIQGWYLQIQKALP